MKRSWGLFSPDVESSRVQEKGLDRVWGRTGGIREQGYWSCQGKKEREAPVTVPRPRLLPPFPISFLSLTPPPPPRTKHPACFLRYVLTKSFWTWSCTVVLAQDQLTVKQFPSWLGKRTKQAHLHLQKTMLAQSHTLLVSAFAATSFQKQLLLSTFCVIAWQLEHSGK